jgi:phospholipid/cholesterol/gamma-HCH transport system substrate-binding protein
MSRKIEFKVGIFIIIVTLLILASTGYVAYKKDVFSKVYTYTLSSKTGENITEGMPVVFWGFNIGKVSSMELTESSVMIQIKIPERNNRVIRAGSRFVLEKPLFSTSRIIVYTDNLKSLPLSPDTIPVLTVSNDINELIKRVQTIAEKMDSIAGNLTTLTAGMADPQGEVNLILKNIEKVTSRLAEQQTLMEMLVGDKESARSIQEIISNARDITVHMDGVIKKADGLIVNTGEKLYGREGIADQAKTLLTDLQAKLANINTSLDNLNKVSGEAANATKDLKALRNDIDETVMSIRTLVDDLDQIIPFKDESEIKLP